MIFREGTSALSVLVKQILSKALSYEWTLQGLGMLRMHFDKTWRLHVWDTRFAFPCASPIHDHIQWDLESLIVAGRMTNIRYIEHAQGNQYMTQTIRAGMGCVVNDDMRPVKLLALSPEDYRVGDIYRQQAKEIHESRPEQGTVTLMRKEHQNDGESARVFWPAGQQWGSAEPRVATKEEVGEITSYALKRWFSEQQQQA